MCAKGKCLYCLEVETGTLIFAIINLTKTIIAWIANLIVIIYVNVALNSADYSYESSFEHFSIDPPNNAKYVLGLTLNLFLGILFAVLSIHLLFAIMLMAGIVKKHTGLVKAYLVYGILGEISCVIFTIILFSMNVGAGFLALFGTVIYLLILIMIGQTYTKLQSGAILSVPSYQHQPLVYRN